MAVVDTIYSDFKDAVGVLEGVGELSLKVMLESNLRKTLLLSAASYFEYTLCRTVEEFSAEITNNNTMINSIIKMKAINRQYHSWFDWNGNNANLFFSLFGPAFKDHMKTRIESVEGMEKSIKSFLEVGRERNKLVHSDYASIFIDKTPGEIYDLYLSASTFVDTVGAELRACSEKIHN